MSTDSLRPWATMFADSDEGLHDLPSDILAARKAVGRLDQALAEHATARPDPNAEQRRLVDATRKAAAAGKPLPAVATIRNTRDALVDHDVRREVLESSRIETAGELVGAIQDAAEAIVTDYLRPVFVRLFATVETAAAVVPENASTDQLLRASDKVRKAWLDLDAAVGRLARLIDTAGKLNRFAPLVHDTAHEFASMTNVKDIWPDWQPGLAPPWRNTDPRVVWLQIVRRGGKLWLPTNSERDSRWWSKYGEAVQQASAHRHDLEAYRAIGTR